MKKVLYFCDFCESIRPHMSENSTIKKYRASSGKFVEDNADIEVKANLVRIFYPLILKARAYREVVYVDFDARGDANGCPNAVVLRVSCSHKLRIWADDNEQTMLERKDEA